MPPTPPVITRFAPSPTGHLHIGGVRTALFCWAYAHRFGGHFVLRIEDTDQARSSEDSARGIMEDLAWCGIFWDEGPEFTITDGPQAGRKIGGDPRGVGPFHQARRIDIYNQYIEKLIDMDKAYPAFDTAEELDAKRKAALAKKETFKYDRAALQIPRDERIRRMRAGEPHVVRLLVPDEPVVVADQVLGEVTYTREDVDDFVLRKADGFPTYHFAVVIDDQLMGVTHILRGQEHLNNTPKHAALQRALGFRTPTYAHLPLIFNPDGTKMSKRDKDKTAREACRKAGVDSIAKLGPIGGPETANLAALGDAAFTTWLGDKQRQLPPGALRELATRVKVSLPEIDVDDFRRSGYIPWSCCNYLALLGWNPGMKDEQGRDVEKFDQEFLRQHFSIERIGKTNSKFDRVKLASFNQDALAAMTDEQFMHALLEWCKAFEPSIPARLGPARMLALAKATRTRVKTISEAVVPGGPGHFAVIADDAVQYDPPTVETILKKSDPATGQSGFDILRALEPIFASMDLMTPESVEAAIKSFCEARPGADGKPLGVGKVAQPLRVALTGAGVSPALGDTCAMLGTPSVLARLKRCLSLA